MAAASRAPGPVEENLRPGTIAHVALPAKDRERARRFYHGVFGWEFLEVPEWGYSLFETGTPPGGGVGPAMLPKELDFDGPLNFILVDSIAETLERIEDAGGLVLVPKTEVPDTGWFAVFRDSEGTILALWERAAGSGWPYWRQDILRTALTDDL